MRSVGFVAWIACASPHPHEIAAPPIVQPRDAAAPADALPPDAARSIAGHLYPKFETTPVYPTRACVDGPDLVFENDCGCNDALICKIDRVEWDKTTLRLELSLDPTRMHTCDDCFAMVPARCPIPPMPNPKPGATWTIVIARQAAFELPVDARSGSCWVTR